MRFNGIFFCFVSQLQFSFKFFPILRTITVTPFTVLTVLTAKGPSRAVQSGKISANQMKTGIIVFVLLSLISGVSLLFVAFGLNWNAILFFLGLGILSILAAIAYTVGKRPYGYAGLGDISVFIFFGLIGVLGSLYLFIHELKWEYALPAISCGVFAIGVLNINNIRDIESDQKAGKYSIPVRIGKEKAVLYHWSLIVVGLITAWYLC
jgi:1,4-dihydroxy-2-naphthoate octaprenyltransferase